MPTRDWGTLLRPLRRSLCAAADFLYPPACALCRRPCDTVNTLPRLLCHDCRAAVAPHHPDRCHRCSAPVGPFLDTQRGCIHCRSDSFAFQRVMSLGVHDGPLRTAVLTAKQQHGAVLATALAELLFRRERTFFEQADATVIVPVPHHWTDRVLKTHLPPETLAARLARLLKTPMSSHILAKVRRTPPQTALNHTERRNNLRGAFRLIGKPDLAGARVLLIDDVLTTGTTAHRAAALLKQAGATVNVAVLARGMGTQSQPAGGSTAPTHSAAPTT